MLDFYEEPPYKQLRLGDVIINFALTEAEIDNPSDSLKEYEKRIKITFPRNVILTNCCDIGSKRIVVTPLELPSNKFWNRVIIGDNPYFETEPSLINRRLSPAIKYGPDKWSALSDQEKEELGSEGPRYYLYDFFLFKPHPRLGPVNKKWYYIDLKRAYTIKCANIVQSEITKAREEGKEKKADEFKAKLATIVSKHKILELTKTSRLDLRAKMAFLVGRIPKDDEL